MFASTQFKASPSNFYKSESMLVSVSLLCGFNVNNPYGCKHMLPRVKLPDVSTKTVISKDCVNMYSTLMLKNCYNGKHSPVFNLALYLDTHQ